MAILRGQAGIQRREIRRDGFTREKRAVFLDHLAMTCHVNNSAAACGINPASARRARRLDPEFATLWADAIAAGRVRLEEELLAHSLAQLSSGDNPGPAREERAVPPFDAKQALDLLKALGALERQGAGGRVPAVAGEAEVNALLMERLEALAARVDRP